jgi:hypothetical protein
MAVGTSKSGVAEGSTVIVGAGWPKDPIVQAIVVIKNIRMG